MLVAEAVATFNWVDVVIICQILITTYRGTRRNFIVELFKTLGLVVSIYLAMHYYSRLSDFLLELLPFFGIFFSDFICFLIIAALSYLAVVLLREGFCRLLKVEAVNLLDKWGGFIFGFLRGMLIASLLVVLLNLSFVKYLQKSVRKSYLGSRLVFIDMGIYEFIFDKVVSKFTPEEKLNQGIYDVIEGQAEAGNETE